MFYSVFSTLNALALVLRVGILALRVGGLVPSLEVTGRPLTWKIWKSQGTNYKVVREMSKETILGQPHWTKIGTKFFSACFARMLFVPLLLNLWSKEIAWPSWGSTSQSLWCIVEILPALLEKSGNFMCSGKWSPKKYTVGHKKRATLLLSISSPIIDRFS